MYNGFSPGKLDIAGLPNRTASTVIVPPEPMKKDE
jgi:hypothetical protein